MRENIQKYDAELKMSAAEAEIAALAETFNLNVTTDFGQIEQRHSGAYRQESRQGPRVAADLSSEGLAQASRPKSRCRNRWRRMRLRSSRPNSGLRSPETTKMPEAAKDLGPAVDAHQSRRHRNGVLIRLTEPGRLQSRNYI